MKLSELLNECDRYDEDLTLYVESQSTKISGDTLVKLIKIPEEHDDMHVEGMTNLMDVWKVVEVLQGKSMVKGIQKPTKNELVAFFV